MLRSKVHHVNDKLVWIDCEMTGLSLETDALVEVSALVTDYELNVLGDGVDLIIKPPAEALDQMDDFVRNMHTNSGLITELDAGLTLREAEEQVLDYVRQHVKEPRKAPLAGNTIGTDRMFLARDFAAPAKRGHHRALVDIQESIEELKYYRGAVFVPQPGPETEAAKAVAAQVAGSVTGAS